MCVHWSDSRFGLVKVISKVYVAMGLNFRRVYNKTKLNKPQLRLSHQNKINRLTFSFGAVLDF